MRPSTELATPGQTSPTKGPSGSPVGPRLALVLWNGNLGGAEAVKAMIAREWRRLGVDASVVFVTEGTPLAARLDRDGVPHASVGFSRGRDVLVHPRRLAMAVSVVGPDGALLVDAGYLAGALRLGGYTGRIVAVEHGKLLAARAFPPARRLRERLERYAGARFRSVDVGVSDFMVAEMRRHAHARKLARIYNGVDTSVFAPSANGLTRQATPFVVGAAARLVAGKGIDQLLRAVATLHDEHPQDDDLRVQIAGDGPERASLVSLAERLGIADVVAFRGAIQAMPEFWRSCDLAVVPSDSFTESFSMATLEAMACGLPVVATHNGGIPEVLGEEGAGTIVPPGDAAALADAIRSYADDPDRCRRHARAALERARACFAIEASAAQYLRLFTEPS
jgi:glycosyltransferase involved in cell wall biosynthesis